MASARLKILRDETTAYELRAHRKENLNYAVGGSEARLSTLWTVPERWDTWSKKKQDKAVDSACIEFQQKVDNREILTRFEQQAVDDERRQQIELEQAAALAEKAALRTVRDYANGVFLPAKKHEMSTNGFESYSQFIRLHIVPSLGDIPLIDITPAMISKMLLDFQARGYSYATTTKLYNITALLFESAFLDDSISISPMLKVKRPKQLKDDTKPSEASKALTESQLAYIYECLRNEPLKWQVYICLLADSGMRRGEAAGLHWTDVDFQSATITVQRNLQYVPSVGIYECQTKTGKARTVDVGADTLNLLRQLRQEQAESCFSKYVFSQDGTPEPMHPQTPTRYFTKFGKRYGIENFHPHLLRHTSASIAITNGADVVSVSQRLGHANASTTLNLYSHANEESIRRAGQIARDAVKAAAQG